MPLNHLHRQGRVCWIAILDYAIGHQPRGTGGQAQLVSIERITPVLLDDVGVGLEDGDELIGRGHAFAGEYPPFSLGDDLVSQLDVVSQFLRHSLGHESAHEVQSLGAHQWGIGSLGEAGRRTGDLQQIAVEPRTLLRARAADPDEPTLGASAVVREGEADQLLGLVQEADQDTDTIPQQRGVGGSMDVRLHAGAVHPDLATVLDSRAVGVSNQGLVDRLECLWPEPLDVALEGGPGRRLVVDAEPAKGLVAARVCQVEGEFLVAEAVHLLDDYCPDYLLGRHAISTGIGPATLQGQIGEHELGDGRLLVQDLAHDHQLEAVNVVDMEVDNRDLRLYDFPHRVIRPFLCCVLANSLYRIGAISSRFFFLIALSFSAVQAFRTGTNEAARLKEFSESVGFYRSHLDKDYKHLQVQVLLTFLLWLICSAGSFAVLVVGIVFLYTEHILAGSITIAADAIVLFIQRVFKSRENYYRMEADRMKPHLEIGNLWNLAVQSVDGLADPAHKQQKLSEIIDALTYRLSLVEVRDEFDKEKNKKR